MLLTLLSMFGGGLMRLLPELMGFLNKKTDNSHELNMLDRQIELEKTQSRLKQQEVRLSGDISETLALLDAQKEAVKGQMQVTGIKLVDALNFLVRPLTTYYMLLIYGLAKLAMFMLATSAGINTWEAISHVYSDDDRMILSSILAFWFVGRVFEKKT